MLLRISVLLFFFVSLYAEVKIFATKVVEKKDKTLLDNPVIVYKDAIIQAKNGVITPDKKIILDKNVTIYKNDGVILNADRLIAKTSQKIDASDVFLYDRDLKGWVLSKKSRLRNNLIYMSDVYFSTCCAKSPDWFMKATKAKFNKKDKSLKLYNLTLVINKVPVLYLPYWYVSFDKTRRSGLLRPYFGYSQKEGFLYSQPIYFVTSVNTDLEVTPTIRTLRGRGVYNTFRFVDSPYSEGSLKFGYFKDKDAFYNKNNLLHQKHYGYQFIYTRNKVFNNDLLYMNIKYADDVDYFYLDAYNYKFDKTYLADKIITSKVNYVYQTSPFLFGSYFQYFIDTSKINNDYTWQILPQLNFHKFATKNYGLINSFDINVYNYTRKKGSNFVLSDISFPLSLYFSMFDNYLKLKLSEIFSGGFGSYYQDTTPVSKYSNLSTQVKLYTSLTKATKSYLHIISPQILLNVKNYSNSRIYTTLMEEPNVRNFVNMSIFQIFNNSTFNISHTIDTTYFLDEHSFTDIENIVDLSFSYFTINETNKYSMAQKDYIYNNIKISYNNTPYLFYVGHIYRKNESKSLLVGFKYDINKYKQFYTEYSYDLIYKYFKYLLIGVKLNKRCWNYNISLKELRRPILTQDGVSYQKDDIINLSIELNPIGGVNQSFVFKGN